MTVGTARRSMPIACAEDVDRAVRLVRERAVSFGFDALQANLIASATSELATNIVLHADHGVVRLGETDDGRGLSLTFEDEGPGIADLELAKVEGYSSRPDGLGIGLAAASQAVDRFDIRSEPGRGTVVSLQHDLPVPEGLFDVGVVSRADAAYPCCGDVVCTRDVRGDRRLLAVIDGMGQGKEAREVASCAREALERSAAVDPRELVERAHRAVLERGGDRGFAIALLVAGRDELRLVSVGDVVCRVFDGRDGSEQKWFRECPGILGTGQRARIEEQRFDVPDRCGPLVVVLASDGVSPRFVSTNEPIAEPSLDIAHALLRDFQRAHGDATVAVLRIVR